MMGCVCHGDGSADFFVRVREGLQNVVPRKERVKGTAEGLRGTKQHGPCHPRGPWLVQYLADWPPPL
jgi:hypothetical protein